MTSPLYQFDNVSVSYKKGEKSAVALREISLSGYENETLGIVGESGCGKTTLAKALLQLQPIMTGKITFDGEDLGSLSPRKLRKTRSGFQAIFQDPDSSLNPKMTLFSHLKEALQTHDTKNLYQSPKAIEHEVKHLLEKVVLPIELMHRFPHEMSGGQKQRASIARALAVKPKLLVLDEPLSSLDLSIRVQIIHLLQQLQKEERLSYLFITHDLATLRYLAQRIAVFYLGEIMELASEKRLYTEPLHPYTQALLDAIPVADPIKAREKAKSRVYLKGETPSLFHPPAGCPFHTRCPFATALCREEKPRLKESVPSHFVACHYPSVRRS